MEKLLQKLSYSYDYIVIDLPPVNIVSDALVVSHLLGGMVVVVRENYSQRREISKCMNQLELAEAKVLGFVMNVKGDEGGIYAKYGKYKKTKYYSGYDRSTSSSKD